MCHGARGNHPQKTFSREGLLGDAEPYQEGVAAGNSKFVRAAPHREAEGLSEKHTRSDFLSSEESVARGPFLIEALAPTALI